MFCSSIETPETRSSNDGMSSGAKTVTHPHGTLHAINHNPHHTHASPKVA